MYSTRMLTYLAVLFLVSFFSQTQATSRYHAAKCIKASTSCKRSLAQETGFTCKAGRKDVDQPFSCRRLACRWCQVPGKSNTPLCATRPLSWMCRRLSGTGPVPKPSTSSQPKTSSKPPAPAPSSKPSPSPKIVPVDGATPEPSPRPSPTFQYPQRNCQPPSLPFYKDSCVWQMRGNDIVIDLNRVSPPSGWTCIQRGPYKGWIYERNKNLGIDGPGAKGKKCFTVNPKKDGDYFFTAMSYSPHGSEHNDVWVNSPDLGFDLWKFGTFWKTEGPNKWLKAYQNNGNRGIIDQLKTRDFDGHRFIIPGAKKDMPFRICLSGRSYKYEMFRLYIVKCYGIICEGVPLKNLIEKRLPTECK